MLSIRKMTEGDLPVVLKIENECFHNPWSEKDLFYELTENSVNAMLVACIDDKVIGFIDFMITFNSSTISQIAISKEYRGNGYGKKLLEAMEDMLPKDGDDQVETITLEVRKSNAVALALYENDGYVKVVDKKNYYADGEDAIYMVKRLI